jgi:hypothetical protein
LNPANYQNGKANCFHRNSWREKRIRQRTGPEQGMALAPAPEKIPPSAPPTALKSELNSECLSGTGTINASRKTE